MPHTQVYVRVQWVANPLSWHIYSVPSSRGWSSPANLHFVEFELKPQGIQNEALTTKPQWLRFSLFQFGSSLTGTDWLQQTWTGPSNSCDIDGAGLLWPGAVIEVKHFKSETVKNKFIGVCKWCDAVVWMLCIWFLSITPHPYSSSQFSFLCIPPLVSCPNFHFVYPTLSLITQCSFRVSYP